MPTKKQSGWQRLARVQKQRPNDLVAYAAGDSWNDAVGAALIIGGIQRGKPFGLRFFAVHGRSPGEATLTLAPIFYSTAPPAQPDNAPINLAIGTVETLWNVATYRELVLGGTPGKGLNQGAGVAGLRWDMVEYSRYLGTEFKPLTGLPGNSDLRVHFMVCAAYVPLGLETLDVICDVRYYDDD